MEGKETLSTMEEQDNKNIFVEEIPKFGKVSMLFYISENCKEKEELTTQIRQYGGNVVLFHECFTYQVASPGDMKTSDFAKEYYRGAIYSSEWIKQSIKEKTLLPKEKYPLIKIEKGREFEYNKGKNKYTLREVILIYGWIKGRNLQKSKRTWQIMVDKGTIF